MIKFIIIYLRVVIILNSCALLLSSLCSFFVNGYITYYCGQGHTETEQRVHCSHSGISANEQLNVSLLVFLLCVSSQYILQKRTEISKVTSNCTRPRKDVRNHPFQVESFHRFTSKQYLPVVRDHPYSKSAFKVGRSVRKK